MYVARAEAPSQRNCNNRVPALGSFIAHPRDFVYNVPFYFQLIQIQTVFNKDNDDDEI